MKLELTNREAWVVYIALNNMQSMGLDRIAHQVKHLGDNMPDSWLNEAIEEHDDVQTVKAKIGVELFKE